MLNSCVMNVVVTTLVARPAKNPGPDWPSRPAVALPALATNLQVSRTFFTLPNRACPIKKRKRLKKNDLTN